MEPLTSSEAIKFVVIALSGLFSGVANSVAGGGGFFVLPTLIIFGLSPQLANGTFRLGLVAQSIVAISTFQHQGVRELRATFALFAPVGVGAALGAWFATKASNETLRVVIGVLLLIWAVFVVARPTHFMSPKRVLGSLKWVAPALVATGFYGGFVQAGVGFPLMAILISGMGYDAVRANAIKVALVFLYTLIALPIFISAGHVAWHEGFALAFGMMIGGWIGVRAQISLGSGFIRWMLVGMIIVSGIAMFWP